MITIPVSNGLLSPQHHKLIATAIWAFLTLIDMVTDETVEDGERWGKVLGGKPITADIIADRIGEHAETTKKHLRKLEQHGYIRTRRTPRGLAIDVRKSIKWLKRSHGASGPSNQQVVAELVKEYHAIPGIIPKSKDIAIIGKVCNQHGPDRVNYAIAKLRQSVRMGEAENPLAVLFGILARLQKNGEPPPQQDPERVQRAQKLARPDCPYCAGTGFLRFISDGTPLPTQVPCTCWKKPSKE